MISVWNRHPSVEHEIDYTIYRNSADFDSTGLFEIGPGRYSGVHWQNGFLFIWEDAFAMAEGILARHFLDYDHFAMNDIPKYPGLKVVAGWREASRLLCISSSDAIEILNIDEAYRNGLEPYILADREKIAEMLSKLADECESFYTSNQWICVLGM